MSRTDNYCDLALIGANTFLQSNWKMILQFQNLYLPSQFEVFIIEN